MRNLSYKASNIMGFKYFMLDMTILASSVALSSSDNFILWFMGQLLFFVFCWHCMVNLHACGHNGFFKTKSLNHLYGNFCSLIPLISFPSWKLIHSLHHKWTGNPWRDPTAPKKRDKPPSKLVSLIGNTCWKLWIPLSSVYFNIAYFYDLRKVLPYASSKSQKFYILVTTIGVIVLHLGFIIFFPQIYLNYIFLGYILYLCTSDLVLLSNHAQIKISNDETFIIKPAKQGHLARDLIFNDFVSKYLFYYFNYHSFHHLNPAVPFYYFNPRDYKSEHPTNWWLWTKTVKKMSLNEVVFETNESL